MLDDLSKQSENHRVRLATPKLVIFLLVSFLLGIAVAVNGVAGSAAESEIPSPAIRLGGSIQLVDPGQNNFGVENSGDIFKVRPASQAVAPYVPAEPILPEQVFSPPSSQWFGYGSPVQLSIVGGEGYAEPSEFAVMEIFKPLRNRNFQKGDEQILYTNLRGGINFESGGFGNFGVGQRHYFSDADVIVDGHAFYDVDGTRDRVFHQISAGAFAESQLVFVRGDYYFPFGETAKVAGHTPLTGNSAFQGQTLQLERFRRDTQAYQGFDAELGVKLGGPSPSTLSATYYDFRGKDTPNIKGIAAAIRTWISPDFSVGLQASFDDVEDTTYLVSASYQFSSKAFGGDRSLRRRLGRSIPRNYHIVSRETLVYDPLAALDASGNEIRIIHAATGTGTLGTVESPFSSLVAAATQATANPGSIVFAHTDSIFTGENVVLSDGLRLLGEGASHEIVTQQLGTIPLPRATMGTARPIIQNSAATSAAITLADNSEVRGFDIVNSGATAVLGDGLTGGLIFTENFINGGTNGFQLSNTNGTLVVADLDVRNTTGNAILFDNSQSASSTTVTGTTTIDGAGGGLLLNNNADSAVTFGSTVAVTNTTNNAITLTDNDPAFLATFNDAVTVDTAGGDGIAISNPTDSTAGGTMTFADTVTVNNVTGRAVMVDQSAADVQFATLQIDNFGQNAISLSQASGTFGVTNPFNPTNIGATAGSTILIQQSAAAVQFADVTITDTLSPIAAAPVIQLVENDTGLNQIQFDSLNITATNRTALQATESGTNFGTLVIGGGSLSTTNSSAVVLDGLSTDITFQSVSASNTAVGIDLQRLGTRTAFHTQFAVTGTGTASSGGVMTGVQTGASILASNDVSLQNLNINSSVVGVQVAEIGTTQSQRLTLQDLILSDGTGSNNWIGIDASYGNGAHLRGLNNIRGNQITGSGISQTGLRITNVRSNPEIDYSIENNSIILTGAGSNGIDLSVTGFGAAQPANFGGLRIQGDLNNLINASGAPLVVLEAAGATVDGQIRINGTLQP